MSSYLENSDGKFIPATKRPDGTWRKARRVKDGYVPQEEVPLYESKGKQFVAQQQTGVPPGMCPMVAAEAKKAREKLERTKVKKDATPSAAKITHVILFPKESNNLLSKALDDKLKIIDDEIDVAKQLKKLRKKIREIELIESKIKEGNAHKVDKDQLDKVKKKPEVLKHLRELEQSQPHQT
ncbi:partner of Y14 and mago [Drosophila busckii]|uniref:partner of Y14 and mago n=1 Tax=Drosophila busckii TaxID=30019 RepID=UPI00083EDD9B|nr:partner of Y14 and mago [Drosophila busckii]